MGDDRDDEHTGDTENTEDNRAPAIPVLQDIVEIRVGPDGQRFTVPLDLEQLATRITAELMPHLRKDLNARLEACLDQALDEALDQIRREVQRVLLEQLGNPE